MTPDPLHVLFVTPECAPWVKTGGLADVAAALPAALTTAGVDVHVLMPAYRGVLEQVGDAPVVAHLPATAIFPAVDVRKTALPSGVTAYLVECGTLYDRAGGPYQNDAGQDYADNAQRFARLAHVAARLASSDSPLPWQPDVLHCNDWQTGLAPAYLRHAPTSHARTLMTVHNLAFQGVFAGDLTASLDMPATAFSINGVEYYGSTSFLKAGLFYADALSTVSPTYAEEIQRPPLGSGLEGLLAGRRNVLRGILNGIDTDTWNPASDPLLACRYDADTLANKAANKRALQQRLGLPVEPTVPLFGVVSRLTAQKGSDLIAAIAGSFARLPAQLVVQGRGDAELERALEGEARAAPGAIGVAIAFDESLAHQIEAGADAFLMPSRFEPCGLNQMYSQRYGTPPVAHRTGGLADSIVDATPATLRDSSATGFLFDEPTPEALLAAINRVIAAYRQPATWRALQRAGMRRDFGWASSARRYVDVYRMLSDAAPAINQSRRGR